MERLGRVNATSLKHEPRFTSPFFDASSSLRRCHVAFPHLPARTLLRAYRHIVQSFILRGAPVRTEQTNNPSRTEKDDGN
ncbi:hypothetical protein AMJ96_PB00435 (plasmid) [Rhizobium sp. N113]|nr:hypothetical protein AMJ96_PB00435 [Rhizobium sp. N113]ARM15141.1 hypothetical protein Bra5_PB00396 [Rhizobium phaseoli Brasil 5]ARO27091.1 hypothetical protein TAL182_PC00493 [Rhizobium sp. TAL182]ARQ60963.1 hypothetical protein Kim5_PA00503 [Rhizobium sp. Kim5]KEC70884.1 hypothetical protein RLPCCGM1_p0658 [Rhizobium leguminosarum bv. phaseoli CCGM1]